MSNTNTGGPAFPSTHAHGQDEGMTLRDYFAAKAMQGYVGQGKSYDFADIAQASYRLADAMLKAREA
jgi:hypothetical protein